MFMGHSALMKLALLLSLLLLPGLAFQSHAVLHRMRHHRTSAPSWLTSAQNDETDKNDDSELDDLTPPSISFTRNSLLFGDTPPTQRNNGPLRLWQGTKSVLPPVVTGAWGDEGQGDTKPVEHLYNLMFVRAPTVLMGGVYIRNLLLGHGLIMNVGEGLFEVPPVIVFGIIAIILR